MKSKLRAKKQSILDRIKIPSVSPLHFAQSNLRFALYILF